MGSSTVYDRSTHRANCCLLRTRDIENIALFQKKSISGLTFVFFVLY